MPRSRDHDDSYFHVVLGSPQAYCSTRSPSLMYRHLPPPAMPHITCIEAIRMLELAVGKSLKMSNGLRASFNAETAKLTYVEPQFLDYIWQDKLKFFDKSANTGRNSDAPAIPLRDGLAESLRTLHTKLEWAIGATLAEASRSAADNRILAEKLSRMSKDIHRSFEGVYRRRKDMETMITDLEMLHVLAQRFLTEHDSRHSTRRSSFTQSKGSSTKSESHSSKYADEYDDDGSQVLSVASDETLDDDAYSSIDDDFRTRDKSDLNKSAFDVQQEAPNTDRKTDTRVTQDRRSTGSRDEKAGSGKDRKGCSKLPAQVEKTDWGAQGVLNLNKLLDVFAQLT